MRSNLASETFLSGARPLLDRHLAHGRAAAPVAGVGLADDLACARTVSRRRKLWEIDSFYHCPIIGTCLSVAELREIMRRAEPTTIQDRPSDHTLHQSAVRLAARHDAPAKLLHRALDRRHAGAVRRHDQAVTGADLDRLWQEGMATGDVPGTFWALMTHPAAGPEIVARAISDVHMLSHLMGASNRADIGRLRALESENDALREQLAGTKERARSEAAERATRITTLERELQQAVRCIGIASDRHDEPEELARAAKRLDEAERAAALAVARLGIAERSLAAAQERLDGLQGERHGLLEELHALEALLQPQPEPADGGTNAQAARSAGKVLLVGARPSQIPHLRRLVNRLDGELLHHDGGVEHATALLPGLVSRSDMIIVPVDCVSHEAAQLAKRLSRQLGKPFQAIRTASAGSLARALAAVPVQANALRTEAASP